MTSSHPITRGLGCLALTFLVACSGAGAASNARPFDESSAGLTAAECSFFDVNGKVRICHATGSAKNPYSIIQVSDSGCVNGHSGHAGDYVATATDMDCHGGGCFPAGAPIDPKIACCPGLVAKNGVCMAAVDLCSGVTCAAADQCHVAGVCNPSTGACSTPAAANGTTCNDNNACTQTDSCQAGACVGSNPVTCAAADQCHVAGVCNPASGACSNPAAADGASCNDNNACTVGDVCNGGTCTPGSPLAVADGNACTVDSCDPATGAIHSAVDVDDGDPCTVDACDPATGLTHTLPAVPAPAHQWTFNDGTTADSAGAADGSLLGGATIVNGALVVDNSASAPNQGTAGQRLSAPIADTTTTKTLVSWVSLASLTQHGGSALTLESTTSNPFAQRFDAVDFGERVSAQWMAGSDNFLRSSANNGGVSETATDMVMIAIAYDSDNSITIYRAGQPYAASYVQGSLQTYSGGVSDALIGLRHSGCSNNCWLSGAIDEARIYGTALNACQVRQLTPAVGTPSP